MGVRVVSVGVGLGEGLEAVKDAVRDTEDAVPVAVERTDLLRLWLRVTLSL